MPFPKPPFPPASTDSYSLTNRKNTAKAMNEVALLWPRQKKFHTYISLWAKIGFWKTAKPQIITPFCIGLTLPMIRFNGRLAQTFGRSLQRARSPACLLSQTTPRDPIAWFLFQVFPPEERGDRQAQGPSSGSGTSCGRGRVGRTRRWPPSQFFFIFFSRFFFFIYFSFFLFSLPWRWRRVGRGWAWADWGRPTPPWSSLSLSLSLSLSSSTTLPSPPPSSSLGTLHLCLRALHNPRPEHRRTRWSKSFLLFSYL